MSVSNLLTDHIYVGQSVVYTSTFCASSAAEKTVTKMQTMNRITKKILKMKNFKNFCENCANIGIKIPLFTKMRFIQNHILRYNLSYSEARVLKFGKCMQRKCTKNSQEEEFLFFYFCLLSRFLFVFL